MEDATSNGYLSQATHSSRCSLRMIEKESVDHGGGEYSRVGRGWVSGPDPSGLVGPMKDGDTEEEFWDSSRSTLHESWRGGVS